MCQINLLEAIRAFPPCLAMRLVYKQTGTPLGWWEQTVWKQTRGLKEAVFEIVTQLQHNTIRHFHGEHSTTGT